MCPVFRLRISTEPLYPFDLPKLLSLLVFTGETHLQGNDSGNGRTDGGGKFRNFTERNSYLLATHGYHLRRET